MSSVTVAAAPAPLTPLSALTACQLDATVLVPLVVAAALYLWGAHRVARRHPRRPWPMGNTVSWLAGLAVIGIATLSSIGVYDDVLFWIHMIQHLLLIMVAPVLLVVGRPATLLLHASRNPLHTLVKRTLHSRVITALTFPLVTGIAYAATIVGTHLTGFMNLVLTHEAVHDAEHLLYLVVGFVYFLPIFADEPIRWRLSYPARALLVALSMPIDTFTGVVLITEPRDPWPAYAAVHKPWMPSLATDVHWGGAVMWIGGDAIMAILMVIVLGQWMHAAGSASTRPDWLDKARVATLAEHVASTRATDHADAVDRPAGLDSDEEQRAAYNAWLAGLNTSRPRSKP